MRKTDFALPCAPAIVIDDLAVHLKQLGWHIAKTRCGWHRQTALHIGCNCCRHSAQWLWCGVGQNFDRCKRARCWRLYPRRCCDWFGRFSDSTVYIFWWQQQWSQYFGRVVDTRSTCWTKIAKKLLPRCTHRCWVIAVLLIHLFDKPRVGAKFLGLTAVKHRVHSTRRHLCDRV